MLKKLLYSCVLILLTSCSTEVQYDSQFNFRLERKDFPEFLLFQGYSGVRFDICGDGRSYQIDLFYQINDLKIEKMFGLKNIVDKTDISVLLRYPTDNKIELSILNGMALSSKITLPANRINMTRTQVFPTQTTSGELQQIYIRSIDENEVLKVYINCQYIK